MLTTRKKAGIQKNRPAIQPVSSYVPTEEESFQLKKGRDLLSSGRVEEARSVFKSLAMQEVPEAMYEYGNLTLLNDNDKTNCAEAVDYLKQAVTQGFIPAKRIMGFLYAFASDSTGLKQRGYQQCNFSTDIPRGSKLLMEATLQGDTIAGKFLDELNLKYGRNN